MYSSISFSYVWRVALVVSILTIVSVTAFAQDTTVEVPVGALVDQWIGIVTSVLVMLLLVVSTFVIAKLPKPFQDLARTFLTEQLLRRAVDYGVNAVRGATKDKVVSVDVGNLVVAQSLQYAVDNGSSWLIAWLGGPEAIKKMIIARLPVAEDTGVLTLPDGDVELG